MMRKKIGVIFDMDGVVVDNYEYHQIAWRTFCKNHGINFNDAFRSGIFGGTNRDHLQAFFGKKLSDDEVALFEEEKEAFYRQVYKDHIKPVQGLISFLEELNKQNIIVGLATSSPPVNVDFVLKETNTRRFFSFILDADSVSKGKPDPEIYVKSIGLTGLNASKCIVFEDSLNGIKAAKSAGAKVVALTTTHAKNDLPLVDLVINDFLEMNVWKLKNLA